MSTEGGLKQIPNTSFNPPQVLVSYEPNESVVSMSLTPINPPTHLSNYASVSQNRTPTNGNPIPTRSFWSRAGDFIVSIPRQITNMGNGLGPPHLSIRDAEELGLSVPTAIFGCGARTGLREPEELITPTADAGLPEDANVCVPFHYATANDCPDFARRILESDPLASVRASFPLDSEGRVSVAAMAAVEARLRSEYTNVPSEFPLIVRHLNDGYPGTPIALQAKGIISYVRTNENGEDLLWILTGATTDYGTSPPRNRLGGGELVVYHVGEGNRILGPRNFGSNTNFSATCLPVLEHLFPPTEPPRISNQILLLNPVYSNCSDFYSINSAIGMSVIQGVLYVINRDRSSYGNFDPAGFIYAGVIPISSRPSTDPLCSDPDVPFEYLHEIPDCPAR